MSGPIQYDSNDDGSATILGLFPLMNGVYGSGRATVTDGTNASGRVIGGEFHYFMIYYVEQLE